MRAIGSTASHGATRMCYDLILTKRRSFERVTTYAPSVGAHAFLFVWSNPVIQPTIKLVRSTSSAPVLGSPDAPVSGCRVHEPVRRPRGRSGGRNRAHRAQWSQAQRSA